MLLYRHNLTTTLMTIPDRIGFRPGTALLGLGVVGLAWLKPYNLPIHRLALWILFP